MTTRKYESRHEVGSKSSIEALHIPPADFLRTVARASIDALYARLVDDEASPDLSTFSLSVAEEDFIGMNTFVVRSRVEAEVEE